MDWDCLEALWEHYFAEDAEHCTDKPILMLSSWKNNTDINSNKFCEILLEKLGLPMLCLALPETMALFSSGRTTGVVTNVGYDSCLTVTVIEGLSNTDLLELLY